MVLRDFIVNDEVRLILVTTMLLLREDNKPSRSNATELGKVSTKA